MAPRREFATTWWGRAWIEALEGASSLDPNRLGRGRTYARQGAVREVSVSPGALHARVSGSRRHVYRVDIGVRRLADAEWDQVAEAIAARAAHAAALLDGELDPAIVADVASVDVRLLPGPGDLRPDCSCPDWAEPCKHAAAVCYLIAAELDRDPLQLFLLRGIEPHDLMARVRAARGVAEPSDRPTRRTERAGVVARERWSERGELGPVPEAIATRHTHPPPGGALLPPPWEAALPARFGIDPDAVGALATDAARRAWSMLVDGAASGLADDERTDLARRAATSPDDDAPMILAAMARCSSTELRTWADAYRAGGPPAVAVVADPRSWGTDSARLDAGKDALVDAGHPRGSVSVNYDSLFVAPDSWLVIGGDGRWYHLRGERHGSLRLVDEPARDPADLVGRPGTFGPAPARSPRRR